MMNKTGFKIKGQAKAPVSFFWWEIILLGGGILLLGLGWPHLLRLTIELIWQIFQ